MKIYECPNCGGNFTSALWDKTTMYELDIKGFWDNYGKIEDERELGCFYICPNCAMQVEGTDIEEV